MVTAEALAARRQEIAGASDLQALLAHLVARAAPLLERLPPIPTVKALLSADGGICPDDGAALEFDPWSPHQHRCPRCGKTWSGRGTTATGRGSSISGWRSGPCTWRRCRRWRATTRQGRGRPRFFERTPEPIGRIPIATTYWVRAGCSSRRISNRSGS